MKTIEQLTKESDEKIKQADVMTEAQMREQKAPWPNTTEELVKYIDGLVDRPHDYGTCVFAMSYAAVAALNYVAGKLKVTGFQASCADLDILRQTRDFNWGRILKYEDLLFPQYCTAENFPSWQRLITDNKEELSRRAKELLSKNPGAHPDVKAHWEQLSRS